MKLKMPVLAEAAITQQVRDYLVNHGWRSIRFQRTIVPGQFQSGEPGQPDYLFVRYMPTKRCPALALTLWIEFKKPNARMRCKCLENTGTRKRCTYCDQRTWKEREKGRGGMVWGGVDAFDWFIHTYESMFGWLHAGDAARGQMDLLIGVPEAPADGH